MKLLKWGIIFIDYRLLNRIVLKYTEPFWDPKQYTFGWIPLKPDLFIKNESDPSDFIWSMAVNPEMEGRPNSRGMLQFMVGGDMVIWSIIIVVSDYEL